MVCPLRIELVCVLCSCFFVVVILFHKIVIRQKSDFASGIVKYVISDD